MIQIGSVVMSVVPKTSDDTTGWRGVVYNIMKPGKIVEPIDGQLVGPGKTYLGEYRIVWDGWVNKSDDIIATMIRDTGIVLTQEELLTHWHPWIRALGAL